MALRSRRQPRAEAAIALALALAAVGCVDRAPDDAPGVAQFTTVAVEPTAAPPAAAVGATWTDAARFLEQATFGPRPPRAGEQRVDTTAHVVEVGVRAALGEQFAVAAGRFAPTPAPAACDHEFPAALDLGSQLFAAFLLDPDQLRLRTMFALHQILVVSERGIPERKTTCTSEQRDAMVRYFNALRARAFGSYRELLEAIVLEPAMGTFLDMANNRAFDADGGRLIPNENFARELLQLFTIGTVELNADGTPRLVGGQPVPTYDERAVQAFARTFTGWTYPAATGCPARGGANPEDYRGPMIACDVNHDRAAQQLLSYPGVVAAGRTTDLAGARQHLEEALDNVFNHPSLPPFVCKQLIQHLVTSNPSPAYVARVVARWKDDGTSAHRTGNLRAVISAILLDPEARAIGGASAGRLRAPVELMGLVLRSLDVRLDTSAGKDPATLLNATSARMGQDLGRPPSVFSYYPPDTAAPGSDVLVGPEFGIMDTATLTARANFLHALLHDSVVAAPGITLASAGVAIDLARVPTTPAGMIAWVAQHWLHGAMSTELNGALTAAIADGRAGSAESQRRLTLYLAALAPELEIQR